MSFVKNPNRNSKRCKTTLMNHRSQWRHIWQVNGLTCHDNPSFYNAYVALLSLGAIHFLQRDAHARALIRNKRLRVRFHFEC